MISRRRTTSRRGVAVAVASAVLAVSWWPIVFHPRVAAAQSPGGEIVYFGIANSDGCIGCDVPLCNCSGAPTPTPQFDAQGRQIFDVSGGRFLIVIEAAPGTNNQAICPLAVPPNNCDGLTPDDPSLRPDLQIESTVPLGNGDPTVDFQTGLPPDQWGGVAAVPTPNFQGSQAITDVLQDFASRFQALSSGAPCTLNTSGNSAPACTTPGPNAPPLCTKAPTAQFCDQVANNSSFPPGVAILTAQVRDNGLVIGPTAQIVVRVATFTPIPFATLSPSTTPSFTRSPSRTATLSPTASPSASATPSRTPSVTRTPSRTATVTPTTTKSSTQTATATATPTRTSSSTQTASPTRTPTRSPTPSQTQTPSRTATPSRTLTPSQTPTVSTTPTATVPMATSINLGTLAAQPGGVACVPALLGGTMSVAGTSNDIGFNASALTFSACTINPTIGPGTLASKQLTVSALGAGMERVGLGGNSNVIPTGALYTCMFSVPANASLGVVPLSNVPSATNPQGSAIAGVQGSVGNIVVTACTGDCDGNGMVSIGEVLRCVNLFLGQPLCNLSNPILSCPVADANHNQAVSIGEVVLCVSKFLNGC